MIESVNAAQKKIELYSLEGKLIELYSTDNSLTKINVSNLESGLYLIKIISDNKIYTDKIFIN